MGLSGKGLGLAATFSTGNPAFLIGGGPADILKNAIGFEKPGYSVSRTGRRLIGWFRNYHRVVVDSSKQHPLYLHNKNCNPED